MLKNILSVAIVFLLFIAPVIGLSQEIEKIRPNKDILVKITYGKKDGEFGRKNLEHDDSLTPRSFTFDPAGNIYIADAFNEIPTVQVFNSKGLFLRKIHLKSSRQIPIVVDLAIKNDTLYVLLFRENIQVFTLAGRPIKTIQYYADFDVSNMWTGALNNPSRMEVDSTGNLYLSAENGALVKLDAGGKLLQKWFKVDYYLDLNNNLFVMWLDKQERGLTVKYASDGKKILEDKCETLFPAPLNQSCLLPQFVDREGRMYRSFREKHKDHIIVRVLKYTKLKSVLIETDLYADEFGDYYKVDMNGNVYTINNDLIKYSVAE